MSKMVKERRGGVLLMEICGGDGSVFKESSLDWGLEMCGQCGCKGKVF